MPLKFIKNKVRKGFSKFAELGKQLGIDAGSYKEGGQLYTYPLTLRSEVNRPVIRFVSYEKDKRPNFVFFPCPPGVTFQEGAQYNTINIGSLGVGIGAVIETVQNISSDVAAGGGLTKTPPTQLIDFIKERTLQSVDQLADGMTPADALRIIGEYVPGGEKVSALAGRKAGSIIAPNATQTYGGNSIRTFNFSFKMVAKSRSEAVEIDKIHKHFRRSIYGEGAGSGANQQFLLKYPPIFNIDFLDMSTGEPNQYIPKIYSCFLQSFSSTFNPSSDMFHRDGAPIEIDVSMDFIESRELNRHDIMELEGEGQATLSNASYAGTEGPDSGGGSSVETSVLSKELL